MTDEHDRRKWDREFRFSDVLPDFATWLERQDRPVHTGRRHVGP